jgi:hypothetical protein
MSRFRHARITRSPSAPLSRAVRSHSSLSTRYRDSRGLDVCHAHVTPAPMLEHRRTRRVDSVSGSERFRGGLLRRFRRPDVTGNPTPAVRETPSQRRIGIAQLGPRAVASVSWLTRSSQSHSLRTLLEFAAQQTPHSHWPVRGPAAPCASKFSPSTQPPRALTMTPSGPGKHTQQYCAAVWYTVTHVSNAFKLPGVVAPADDDTAMKRSGAAVCPPVVSLTRCLCRMCSRR